MRRIYSDLVSSHIFAMNRKRAVLTVTDLADPSVGQFSSSSTVETPLFTDDMA